MTMINEITKMIALFTKQVGKSMVTILVTLIGDDYET